MDAKRISSITAKELRPPETSIGAKQKREVQTNKTEGEVKLRLTSREIPDEDY